MKEHREISLRMKLPKGKYLIVPSTRNPNEAGKFYLSVYFDNKLKNINHVKRVDNYEECKFQI